MKNKKVSRDVFSKWKKRERKLGENLFRLAQKPHTLIVKMYNKTPKASLYFNVIKKSVNSVCATMAKKGKCLFQFRLSCYHHRQLALFKFLRHTQVHRRIASKKPVIKCLLTRIRK